MDVSSTWSFVFEAERKSRFGVLLRYPGPYLYGEFNYYQNSEIEKILNNQANQADELSGKHAFSKWNRTLLSQIQNF